VNRHLTQVVFLVAVIGWCPHAAFPQADISRDTWRRRRPVVMRVDVAGNRAVSDGDVRGVMQIRTSGFSQTLGLKDKPRLLFGAEERDEAAIRLLYRRHGFWDAKTAISVVPDSRTQRALVTVFIEEGTRYRWGTVNVTGDHDDLVTRSRRSARPLKRGAAADSTALAVALAGIRTLCANRGHPQHRVAVVISPRADTLDVAVTLHAGPPVLLGDLTIDGAERTRESYIRREIRWRPGTRYSQRRIADDQFNVYATGLFTFVSLEPTAVDSADTNDHRVADFQLRVVERKPSFIGFRTGVGQDPDRDLTWDYAFELGSRNWFGTGRKWSLTAQSGFVVVTDWRVLHHRFAASYTEPRVLNVRLPTTLTVAFEPGVRSAKQDYSVERWSAELNVTRRIRRISQLWSSLVFERVKIFGIAEDRQAALIAEEGISQKRRWSFIYERDSRPSVFVPKSGSRTRIGLEYVGGLLGGESDFYKVDLLWARYQMIDAPTVLATRLRLAWVKTHSGGTSVPTIDRYYAGGANTIRGYAENTIGPVDSTGAPTGGEVLVLASAELRTPVIWKFWFSIFGDMGNNWGLFRDVALNDMLVSLGVGWHYMAPVGPIRLDYARRVVHGGYPASDRVHLSILFSF